MTTPHYAVTGVACGIGAALAARLLDRGCRVTGFDVRPPADAAFPCHAVDLADLGRIDSALAAADGPFDGLRINAVCPGAVATGLLTDFAAAFGEAMARNLARAGRPGQPEEIAAVADFLLGPDSSWLRGAEISPDGGMGAFAASDALGLAALRL